MQGRAYTCCESTEAWRDHNAEMNNSVFTSCTCEHERCSVPDDMPCATQRVELSLPGDCGQMVGGAVAWHARRGWSELADRSILSVACSRTPR